MNRLFANISLLLALATSASAMLVQPAATPPPACEGSSDYTFIVDSAVPGENSCRNNPVDNSDPLGLSDDDMNIASAFGVYDVDALVQQVLTEQAGGLTQDQIRGQIIADEVTVAAVAVGVPLVETAASIFIPYAGEAMDAEVLADPASGKWERRIAGTSLTIGMATGGLMPNVGRPVSRIIRAIKRVKGPRVENVLRPTTTILHDVTVISHGKVVGKGDVYLGSTLEGIESGGISPRDIFRNDQDLLPTKPPGYYEEFVHPTPGVSGAGSQRIVRGAGGELYYTPDHYATFIPLN